MKPKDLCHPEAAANTGGSLGRLAARYGYGPESAEGNRLAAYLALLERWNARVNLTAATDWPAIGWLFEEALWSARWYPQTMVNHLDIGSGAGFPAVPLKILRPAMRLRLIESRARRAAFLETVAATLDLAGVEIAGCRVEDYLRTAGPPIFDIVSWKGIRLSREAVELLADRSRPETQFWLFHGKELPLAEPAGAQKLRLLRREAFPGRAEHWLSIFAVSRETSST